MTIYEMWEYVKGFMLGFGIVIAFLSGIAKLYTYTSKYKEWRDKKNARNQAIEYIANEFGEFKSNVGSLTEENDKQNIQIQKSNEERKLLMKSTLAVLDWIIKQGANGTAHAARDEIVNYQLDNSHKIH
ncbi:MAG: hypothetical protein Q4A42_02990 [Tissierellia bacterium]|nr:hypothetical protein [Tissierellia bacterium]